MKIGIHHRKGSFSERWISYCKYNNIQYDIINCFDTNIIETLRTGEFTHVMWHINHASSKDLMVFPYVLNSADALGIKTFPDYNTRWHFDDKVAQKYLFEAIGAPVIKSHVFYNKKDVELFSENIEYPIVGKLKRGAGSTNVFLLKDKIELLKYSNKMFSEGISSSAKSFENLNQKIRIAKKFKDPVTLFKKIIGHIKKNKKEQAINSKEKAYVYLQDFMPNNTFDTRIVLVGDVAYGVRRFNRKNDFRASGSGKFDFNPEQIDKKIIELAFKINKRLKMQSVAFDFIYDSNKNPKIVEVCFGFDMKSWDPCKGYWNKNIEFIEDVKTAQSFMMEQFLEGNK